MPGFPAGTISSTFLAGTISDTSGQHSRHIAIPGRLVVYALLFIVFVIILLALPVIWQAVSEAFSSAAEKAAPGTFFLGLGVLFIGLVAGVELLDIVGASLVGLVILGVIVDNYLAAVRHAASVRPAACDVPLVMGVAARARTGSAGPAPGWHARPSASRNVPGHADAIAAWLLG